MTTVVRTGSQALLTYPEGDCDTVTVLSLDRGSARVVTARGQRYTVELEDLGIGVDESIVPVYDDERLSMPHEAQPDPNGRDNCLVCGAAIRFDDLAPHDRPRFAHGEPCPVDVPSDYRTFEAGGFAVTHGYGTERHVYDTFVGKAVLTFDGPHAQQLAEMAVTTLAAAGSAYEAARAELTYVANESIRAAFRSLARDCACCGMRDCVCDGTKVCCRN